ncbi:hypothetical protein [Blastococcus haudaquaticus]|uniref:Cell wall-active antibiotics response LiaF-like C-terminal domain-containing protein n=1 Tax=Blastococcus haudaquaticus TaxID=1938745 RepID=A0A286GKQ1_9ACTN|nr:hypothetical protein [Blastococcus haudaquaticus]SOD95756.1 hypothetical protein SAMN06272739_1353 [Blastococcus haudaquaticus]
MRRSLAPVLRALRPWFVGWFAFQAVVAAVGWLTARRQNEGDESSTSIRRVLTHSGLELRPRNPALSRLRVDMAMSGAEIDLTGLPRSDQGIDLTLRVLMGGAAVRVPPDWRVWWRFRGVGGMGGDGVVQRTHDEHAADLRIHAVVVLGGVGVEAG